MMTVDGTLSWKFPAFSIRTNDSTNENPEDASVVFPMLAIDVAHRIYDVQQKRE
jgi:hypothetical protein